MSERRKLPTLDDKHRHDLDLIWDRDRYLSLKETAHRLGMAIPTVQQRVRRGTFSIPAVRRGRGWYFRVTDVERYLANRPEHAPRRRRVLAGTIDHAPPTTLHLQPLGSSVPTARDRLRAARAREREVIG